MHKLEESRQLPLFGADRLARKPYCSNTKDQSYIRPLANALKRPYIQPNSPTHFYRVVVDLDYHKDAASENLETEDEILETALSMLDIRFINDQSAWTKELGVPAPSWVALSPDKNSAHVGFELAIPVARHEHARLHPIRYLQAVERGLIEKMHGDPGYAGFLCKNPLSPAWDLLPGRSEPFELAEFGHYFDFPKKKQSADRTPRGEVGRAVYLFDEVRFWAYDHIAKYRAGSYDAWAEVVLQTAEAINGLQYGHLPLPATWEKGYLGFSEVKSAARSVARWTWANYGNGEVGKAFSELQAYRGTLGAAASAKVKRERTEQQIVQAIELLIAQGQIPTIRAVAKLIGKSPSGLSTHYKHLFQSTMQ